MKLNKPCGRKPMITTPAKRKIQEFLDATNWSRPDWEDAEQVSKLLDVLKAFNNDPKTAIRYWKNADQKAKQAVENHYRTTIAKMGFSTKDPVSHKQLYYHFKGNLKAIDQFFIQLEAKGQAIAQQVFQENFSDVVLQMLARRNTVQ